MIQENRQRNAMHIHIPYWCYIIRTSSSLVSMVLLHNQKCQYCQWADGSFLPKQYSQFIQEGQVDFGNGPDTPRPDGGRHRPITDMYLAARWALGMTDNLSTSSTGKTTWSTPMLNISADIRCNDITNCARIWSFDIKILHPSVSLRLPP